MQFPQSKLKTHVTQANKIPLVLVACGSFSPITNLHVEMFGMTERYAAERTNFEVVGCYLSPVSDAYKKTSLVSAQHRLNMCNLAVEKTNIMVDTWEALRCDEAGEPLYTATHDVLRHFDEQINEKLGGTETPDGTKKRTQVALLIGADVAMTMNDLKVWPRSDLDQILGVFGAFIVERPAQTDIDQALEPLKKHYDKIWRVPSSHNDVSSTKIRAQIRNGEHSQDLPRVVTEYIKTHSLYQADPKDGHSSTKPCSRKVGKLAAFLIKLRGR